MRRGVHCAAFTIRALPYANVGVVGADFDPSQPATTSSTNWTLATYAGSMYHNGPARSSGRFLRNAGRYDEWPGNPGKLAAGDVVVSACRKASGTVSSAVLFCVGNAAGLGCSDVRQILLVECGLSFASRLKSAVRNCRLTVYLNGRRLGVMIEPGRVYNSPSNGVYHGQPVPPLVGPLRWAASVSQGATVQINGAHFQ